LLIDSEINSLVWGRSAIYFILKTFKKLFSFASKMRKTVKILLSLLFLCVAQINYAGAPVISGDICISDSATDVCYTIDRNGSTITEITAIGDIQMVSSTGLDESPVKYCIKSYADLKPNCTPDARTKGRIIVRYKDGNEEKTVFLDVYKRFSEMLPPIVGADCVFVGDTITYSVCRILSANTNYSIGQDSYTWFVPDGLTLIFKTPDNSSQTYVINAIPTKPLQVQFGQCNPAAVSSLDIVVCPN
jgi:hypothetical protein